MVFVFYMVLVVVVIVVVAVSVGVGHFVQDNAQDVGFAFFQEGFSLPGFFGADFSAGQDEDDSIYLLPMMAASVTTRTGGMSRKM